MRFLYFFLFLNFVFFTSCVSNKKHLEEITQLQTSHEALLKKEIDERDVQINYSENQIRQLQLQLAERKGENNALTAMQDKLQAKIDLLEDQIESNSNQSMSTSQSLNKKIQDKEKEIAQLNKEFQEINAILDRNQSILEQLSNDLSFEMQNYDQSFYEIARGTEEIILNISSDELFKTKSTTRLKSDGITILEKVGQVLVKYPSMHITVSGHTDNSPPPSRSYVDNWNYSALRAATIVRILTDELDLNPSQVLAAAKGEFSPRASNVDPEGKKKNRRIEFRIAPRTEELSRAIRKKLEARLK